MKVKEDSLDAYCSRIELAVAEFIQFRNEVKKGNENLKVGNDKFYDLHLEKAIEIANNFNITEKSLSKVFKSKNTCNGNMCAWNGNTCKVEVKHTVRKDTLFYRILTTLLENTKIRAMVLDGRTTPFFSTVLYLEMPNELIVSDSDIGDIAVR